MPPAIEAPLVARILFLALACFASGWLGLSVSRGEVPAVLVWLPSGVALAALLRWGQRLWPGAFLGFFLFHAVISSSWAMSLFLAVGDTLGVFLTVWGLGRAGFHAAFDRQREVGSFILAALAGAVFSATWGLIPASPPFGLSWLYASTAGTLGSLLIAPLILTLSRPSLRYLSRDGRELALWSLLACLTAWLSFGSSYGALGQALPLAFLPLPLIVWAGLRLGHTGTALAALAFSLVAAWSTAAGHGPFSVAQGPTRLFLLWGYQATVVLTGLLIAAMQTERLAMEANLRASEEKLRGLFELSPLGIALTDMAGRYVEFNEAFQKICGYSAEELKALDYWAITPRKYHEDEARQLESLKRTGHYGPYEKEYRRKDGSLVPLRLNGMLIGGEHDQCIWSLVEDISDRKRIEGDLQVAATAFEAQVGILVTDAKSRILRVNRAFTKDTGYTAAEAVGQTPRLFKSERHGEAFYAALWDSIQRTGGWQGEIWNRAKDGAIAPKWMTISAVKGEDGEASHYVCTQTDITARKAAEDEIRSLAFFDPLTRLPNRRLLLNRLHHALAASHRSQRQGALLFIDLDNFKTLNDTLGHDKGDLLLQQVAERLASSVREGDTVARLGGDEFVVMLEDLNPNVGDAAAQAETVGEKILSVLNRKYRLAGHEYHSTPSIGVTLFGSRQETMDELMKQADLAMYQAKAAGRNALRFFDPGMQAAVTARVALEADLRQAVQDEQFLLYYQPQVAGKGELTGAEVLIRWHHPERGMVFPDQFISLAEDTGLILPMGQWVLESACRQLAAWALRPETARLSLAVNVSTQQLRKPDFVGQVLSALEQSGADPARLKLELTESKLMDNVEDTIAKMGALKEAGVGFALDDFGTGYSSLSYLKRLPLEKLKIERSFVMDVLTDPNDAVIATTIVTLAQSLGLDVIAEGVETEAQRVFLEQNGCHAYQGYLFSRPLPLADFEKFILEDGKR